MCLLINHPAATTFTFDDIDDFYSYNSDGLGIMYAEEGVLYVKKLLPDSGLEAWNFYKAHAKGRDCVIHFRMKTHGHIDLDNCHPYEVFGDGSDMPLWMAHNGVLPCGNAKDTSKSDTFHYIQDIIIPCAKGSPEVVFEPAFVELIEEHIGSGNKFIFMNHEGRVSIVNRDAFVTYSGAELSNTYAWTASKGGYGLRSTYYGGYGYGKGYTVTRGGYTTPTRHLLGNPPKDYLADDLNDPVVDLWEETTPEEFASELFTTLQEMGYSKLFKDLEYNDAVEFYNIVGEGDAYDFIVRLEDGAISEQQAWYEIQTELLAEATKPAAKQA